MDHTSMLTIIISILYIEFALEQILSYLNYKKHRDTELPEELKTIYTSDAFERSKSYHSMQYKLQIVSSLYGLLLSSAMLFTGGFGWALEKTQMLVNHDFASSLLFLMLLFFANDILTLPFQWYDTFVLEQKFGFNTTTVRTFVLDKLKGYALGAVVGSVIFGLMYYLVRWLGADFWWIFWIVVSILILGLNVFYTSWIVPLFNKLSPMQDGPLKTKILEYCDKVSFPLDNLYVVDGSKRSKKANAYFSGLGKKKKVVFYDTLLENQSDESIVAVLAHEVGHYKHRHIILSMILSVLVMGIALFFISQVLFSIEMSYALGGSKWSLTLNLISFSFLYSPFSTLTGIAMQLLSRKNEFEADNFAKETYGAAPLVDALEKLSTDNLSNPVPHPAYVFVHYSHPPLLERIRNLRK